MTLIISSRITLAQTAKTETDIDAIIKKFDAVGLAVAVVKDNKLIYTHSFGLKDIGQNVPLNNTDIFRIASISKSFSATGIMQLAEAKKLSLDDDFSKLIGFKIRNPKYPETVITLRMVMSHTSSINDSQGYFNLDVINPDKSTNWAKCYNDYEPGKGYQYCNLNYNMVGTVIEKISGERFDHYIKHHIIEPLGLYAGYEVSMLDSARFVTLYEYNRNTKTFVPAPLAYNPRRNEIENYVMGSNTPIFSPTGGMKISATDLARYMMMHMNYGKAPKGKRIISKESAKTMQTQIADKDGYGLAIRTVTDLIPGTIMKGHTGSAYGLYSAMFFQPEQKFGFVVITNGTSSNPNIDITPILRETINSLYDNLVKK
ncbi:serine hydrolase domain-containing protein [Mucilaginibacter myungsuensis]|nr:serine hydrolase domain-containing protein [Mucilaginibacter myungsuensis]MDN3600708.1 serine hydrolase domain-containing protein [Mucilaginibacter myungsuensis]